MYLCINYHFSVNFQFHIYIVAPYFPSRKRMLSETQWNFFPNFCRGQPPGWSFEISWAFSPTLSGDLARCGDVESAELGEEILRYMLRSLAPGTQCVTVDGSEIWDSPVEFGDLSHYFAGFLYIPSWFAGFLPSTVVSGRQFIATSAEVTRTQSSDCKGILHILGLDSG